MQVTAAPVDEAAIVPCRAERELRFVLLDEGERVAIARRDLPVVGLASAAMWRGRAAASIQPCFRSQLMAYLATRLLNDVVSAVANVANKARARHAELALDRRFPADAGDELAAVAPRGSPADAVRLEENDRIAALGERQRRGDTGEAAADDADVGLVPSLETRISGASLAVAA